MIEAKFGATGCPPRSGANNKLLERSRNHQCTSIKRVPLIDVYEYTTFSV